MTKALVPTGVSKGLDKKSQADVNDDAWTGRLNAILSREPSNREHIAVQEALDWWLEYLPIIGAQLTPELQLPPPGLLDVFMCGRFSTHSKGHRLHEEGEEVRSYTIVLLGKCRLRCRAPPRPAPPKKPGDGDGIDEAAAAAAEAAAAGIDPDGLVTCGYVGPGESLGQLPSEQRSSHEITVAERSVLLQLNADDYTQKIRPHLRRHQANAVRFLQSHHICPQAISSALQRLAIAFRCRTVKRGQYVTRCGERQRSVWFLRDGAFSIIAPETGDDASLNIGGDSEDELLRMADNQEREEQHRLDVMRLACHGREEQQALAADEERRNIVSQHASAKLSQALELRPQPPLLGGSGLRAVSLVQTPGASLGEEVLLYENFRDMIGSRYFYTARAEEDCSFYVADLSSFRHLAMCTGTENVAFMVNEKLNRRFRQLGRNDIAMRKVGAKISLMRKRENEKSERPQIYMPPCTGYRGPTEVEDVDDWLLVTKDHRKSPQDHQRPPTLSCVEGLVEGLGDKGRKMFKDGYGPGVRSAIKHFKDDAALKKWRASLAKGGNLRRHVGHSENPMGESVAWPQLQSDANSLSLPGELSKAVTDTGSFFQTEPDWGDGELRPLTNETALPSTTARSPLHAASALALPKLSESQASRVNSGEMLHSFASGEEELSSISVNMSKRLHTTHSAPNLRGGERAVANTRQKHVLKRLGAAVQDKSILVLTDKPDVRKAISSAFMDFQAAFCFLKSTNELWHRMRDRKEQHHVLVLDLAKFELQVEGVLRTIRQHERYSKLPIVVISAERELSELVRTSCSFVVFKPLAASMLREALLWCFDPRALQGLFRRESHDRSSTELSLTSSPTMVTPSVPVRDLSLKGMAK